MRGGDGGGGGQEAKEDDRGPKQGDCVQDFARAHDTPTIGWKRYAHTQRNRCEYVCARANVRPIRSEQ